MSFGFGIGDFVLVVQLANDLRRRYADAPAELRDVHEWMRTLSNVLRDLDDLSPQQPNLLAGLVLTDQQREDLGHYSQTCHGVLEELRRIADKNQEVHGSDNSIRRVWKRLKWKSEEVTNLRSRLMSSITALNTFYASLTRQIRSDIKVIVSDTKAVVDETKAVISDSKTGIDHLVKMQDDQQRREFLEWLSPAAFGYQQSDILRRWTPGTGSWLLDSQQFKDWAAGSGRTLFCPGMPGSGKTIMSAMVIRHLSETYSARSDVGIAYVYFNYNRSTEQTSQNVLASILEQLLCGRPALDEKFNSLHQKYESPDKVRPSAAECAATISTIAATFSRLYVIIDVLDECTYGDGTRDQLIESMISMRSKAHLDLFITSREDIQTRRKLGTDLTLEIRAADDDVRRYLSSEMPLRPLLNICVHKKPGLKDEVEAAIVNAVQGMFLLAGLHLDSLTNKTTPKAVRSALEQLPKGSNVYERTYQQAEMRIASQGPDLRELGRRIISWLVYAKRELKLIELQHALAVEIGAAKLDEDNIEDPDTMISVCAGLVVIEEASGIIRLVHYTTQEYFETLCLSWEPHPPTEITKACLTYLAFDVYSSGPVNPINNYATQLHGTVTHFNAFDQRLEENRFFDYASVYWGEHAKEAHLSQLAQLAVEFLTDTSKTSSAGQGFFLGTLRGRYSRYDMIRDWTGLHLVSYFGLTQLASLLLDHGQSPDEEDSRAGRTPLSCAAGEGHTDIAKLLVERDDVNADSDGDYFGRTPLSWAASNGHLVIVKLLTERRDVNINSRDSWARTPLISATKRCHLSVVSFLVEQEGIMLDLKDCEGRTALFHALASGNPAMCNVLAAFDQSGLDPTDKTGRTPLSLAAAQDNYPALEYLLARGANLMAKDSTGRLALSWAAAKNKSRAVAMLLAKHPCEGSRIGDVTGSLTRNFANMADERDSGGRTPLNWAASGALYDRTEAVEVIKLLLARSDINVNSADCYGLTPLKWAMQSNGTDKFAQLLTRPDVDVNTSDVLGLTPLCWAVMHEFGEDFMSLLLDRHEINVDKAPPLLAALNQHRVAVTKLMRDEFRYSIGEFIPEGRTPLSFAAQYGDLSIVELLLERDDIDVNVKDLRGWTALYWAIYRNDFLAVNIVQLLCSHQGVDINAKDHDGRTPLFLATTLDGHAEALVKILLEHQNIDLNAKDSHGRTALSWATTNSHKAVKIMECLLTHERLDVNAKDTQGRTALIWATTIRRQAVNVIECILMHHDIDINAKDRRGRTALSLAISRNARPIIKLLMEHGAVRQDNTISI